MERTGAGDAMTFQAFLQLSNREGADGPEKVRERNIHGWYLLWNKVAAMVSGKEDEGPRVLAKLDTLFIVFDVPIETPARLTLKSDAPLPQYEVKQLFARYAIVAFSGSVPAGTLTVTVYA